MTQGLQLTTPPKKSGEKTKKMDKALYNTHIKRAIMTCSHCSHDTKVTQQ